MYESAYTNRMRPVSSSCIMPCLMWRALASRDSSSASSVSMSLRMVAMAVYSSKDEGINNSNSKNVGSRNESTVAFTEFSMA